MNKGIGGASNTRPERANEIGLRGLVDWLSITFQVSESDYTQITQLIGLGKLDFEYHDWGTDTFTSHIRYSNIVIQQKQDDIYQLRLSGQGCREYETLSDISWLNLFLILKDFCDAKATRLDLAIDDFKGYYDVALIRRTFLEGRCVTRLKYADDRKRYTTGDQSLILDSFYIGSMNSRLSINFYDKKLERDSAGYETTVDKWTRTELRLKREYADDAIDMLLLHDGDFGKVAFGILKGKIRFVQKSVEKRKAKNIQWWDRFMSGVSELQLSLKAPDKTIERSKEWISSKVAPTLAMILEADEKDFKMWFDEVITNGHKRLTGKHDNVIKQYKDTKYQNQLQGLRDVSNRMDDEMKQKLNQIKKNAHSKNEHPY